MSMVPELKSPEVFRGRGMDMTPAVIASLRKNGLDRSDKLILQSFDEQTLRTLARDRFPTK